MKSVQHQMQQGKRRTSVSIFGNGRPSTIEDILLVWEHVHTQICSRPWLIIRQKFIAIFRSDPLYLIALSLMVARQVRLSLRVTRVTRLVPRRVESIVVSDQVRAASS